MRTLNAITLAALVALGAPAAARMETPENQSGSFPAVIHPGSPYQPAYGVYVYAAPAPLPSRMLGMLLGRGTATIEHRLHSSELADAGDTSARFRTSLTDARSAAATFLAGTPHETIEVLLTDGARKVTAVDGIPATWGVWEDVLGTLPDRVRAGGERSIQVTLDDGTTIALPVYRYTTITTFTPEEARSITRAHPERTVRPTLPYLPDERGPERADGISAGLAYALSHLNHISGGLLLGDRRIHASGTIDPAGTVGEVDGFPAKAEASRLAGADLLIVPRQNLPDAYGHGVPVVGVSNLQEAVQHLCRLRIQREEHPAVCR